MQYHANVPIVLSSDELQPIVDGEMNFRAVLQVVNVPECMLFEPGMYHLQLTDGEKFINAVLPFTGNDCDGSGVSWLYEEMAKTSYFSIALFHVTTKRFAVASMCLVGCT